jgi:hypothetical protein
VGDWYDSLSSVQQFLFLTGVFSTVVFAGQLLLTLVGLGDDDGDAGSGDDGSDGIGFGDIFTLRNGVSFLMGFSWGGLMAYSWGLEYELLVAVVGFMVGMGLVAINMLLLFVMSKLKHDGSIKLENAIGEQATVTLPIPANRSGVGKVRISIQGRLKEYHAVTDGAALTRHAVVRVLDLTGSQLVVTSKAASNKD